METRPSENLGQVLFGERIESSPYKVQETLSTHCIYGVPVDRIHITYLFSLLQRMSHLPFTVRLQKRC